jgi:hypothetical protein
MALAAIVASLANLSIGEVCQLRDIVGQQIELSIRNDADGDRILNIAELIRNHQLKAGTQYYTALTQQYPVFRAALVNEGINFPTFAQFQAAVRPRRMLQRFDHFMDALDIAMTDLGNLVAPSQNALRLIEVINAVKEWAKESV